LSIATRKAASARNTALVALLFMVTVAIFPMLNNNVQVQMADSVVVADEAAVPDLFPTQPTGAAPDSAELATPKVASPEDELSVDLGKSAPADSRNNEEVNLSGSVVEETGQSQIDNEEADATLARDAFNGALDENLVLSLASQALNVSESNGQVTAVNETGLTANFAIDLNSEQVIQYLVIEFASEDQVWMAVPQNSLSVVEEGSGETFISYAATDFLVGDFSGEFDYVSTTESVFSRSGIRLEIVLDGIGEIVTSQVAFLPKT